MSHHEDKELDRLFEAARSFRPDTSEQEDHFETRVMARLLERRMAGPVWFSWVWRLIPAFAALAVILGIADLIMESNRSSDILAAIVNGQTNQLISHYLMGG
ncbi:MAG: hypothetical protein CSYNP_01812 [Syntrophus sp. SKADARSKE-3]|nr:hypothetical protein [Syntrophus sp. SKADARSKE-3]